MSDVSTETIEHLDFTPELACEVRHGSSWADSTACPEPAAWVSICEGCGNSILYCDGDRRRIDLAFAEGWILKCVPCGSVSSIAHPRHRFVPIGVA